MMLFETGLVSSFFYRVLLFSLEFLPLDKFAWWIRPLTDGRFHQFSSRRWILTSSPLPGWVISSWFLLSSLSFLVDLASLSTPALVGVFLLLILRKILLKLTLSLRAYPDLWRTFVVSLSIPGRTLDVVVRSSRICCCSLTCFSPFFGPFGQALAVWFPAHFTHCLVRLQLAWVWP